MGPRGFEPGPPAPQAGLIGQTVSENHAGPGTHVQIGVFS